MNFIKLGKKYVNLDNVAAILPKENGLGYTINFIGHRATMDICEMDMVDIKKSLKYGRNNHSRNRRNQHYSQLWSVTGRNFRNG